MDILYAPWRYEYVSTSDDSEGCVFCRIIAQSDDKANFVLKRGSHNIAILNRYPYTAGHLMVAPLRHLDDPAKSSAEELAEMAALVNASTAALREQYSPQGFNIGMNIGRVSGAGVEHHYHVHVVPRWGGDTSFITITGEARVVPEGLESTWKRLEPLLADFVWK